RRFARRAHAAPGSSADGLERRHLACFPRELALHTHLGGKVDQRPKLVRCKPCLRLYGPSEGGGSIWCSTLTGFVAPGLCAGRRIGEVSSSATEGRRYRQ